MNLKSLGASILILLAGSMNISYSCEPIIPRHPFRDSKAVFFGELVEITETNDRCVQIIKLKVERYWKGKLSQYISVQTPTPLCCGYGGFHVGGKYLVYAYLERGANLETTVGWVFIDDLAAKRMKKLGKGTTLESNSAVSLNRAAQQLIQPERGIALLSSARLGFIGVECAPG